MFEIQAISKYDQTFYKNLIEKNILWFIQFQWVVISVGTLLNFFIPTLHILLVTTAETLGDNYLQRIKTQGQRAAILNAYTSQVKV